MAAILAALAALLVSVAFYSAQSMDNNAVDRQRALIDNALSLRLAQSLSELRSVAWWDEAVSKSRADQFDANWLDIEVGVFVTTSYAHDRVLIIDEVNNPVYGFGHDARLSRSEQEKYTRALMPLISQIRGGKNVSPRITDNSLLSEQKEASKITDRSYGRGAAAILSVDGKPVLASIMSITPSIDMSLNSARPRLLASVIDLNAAVMTDIGKSVLVPDLAGATKKSSANFVLKSDEGKIMQALGWSSQNPGRGLISDILPLIFMVLIATAASLYVLFKRLLSSTRTLAIREKEAQHLANHDTLTGLPNRRKLEAELFSYAGKSDTSAARLAVAIVDLDRFKDINDTLGHHAGDDLIRAVADRLKLTLADTDFVARLGGDEFAVLRTCWELNDADELTTLITSVFATPFSVMGHQIEANASVGLAIASYDRAIEDLVREADIALYEAKARSRGCTVHFAPSMARKIEQRRTLEIDLKHAIATRALSMHYQPIVEAATGAITSVEALLRWQCPKHGNISPEIFVPIAEETGLMAELGRFVIEQAVEDSKRWPGLTTAINISPAQLRSASILQDLMDPIRKHGVSASQITIEITESILMANDQRTLRTLNILKDRGFSLALDDFGTGYSSLAYVRDFPFDRLKIDRSFVTGLADTERSVEIIKAIVNFGKILGREIIAEGIETETEMQAMQAAGVTHLQGYLFSKPVSATHIEALISTSGRLSAARMMSSKPSAEIKEASDAKIRRIV
ncbi:MAG: bifunctional diguanylate cyclase/phosphodiesterase [Chakrabartia sp.]